MFHSGYFGLLLVVTLVAGCEPTGRTVPPATMAASDHPVGQEDPPDIVAPDLPPWSQRFVGSISFDLRKNLLSLTLQASKATSRQTMTAGLLETAGRLAGMRGYSYLKFVEFEFSGPDADTGPDQGQTVAPSLYGVMLLSAQPFDDGAPSEFSVADIVWRYGWLFAPTTPLHFDSQQALFRDELSLSFDLLRVWPDDGPQIEAVFSLEELMLLDDACRIMNAGQRTEIQGLLDRKRAILRNATAPNVYSWIMTTTRHDEEGDLLMMFPCNPKTVQFETSLRSMALKSDHQTKNP